MAESSPFAHRGVVEGFYGRPYPHAERLWLIDRMAAWGMNTYVHAPKDDPLHRERWREPYPDEAMAELRALVAHGEARGVRVGFAISPGLSIEYGSERDRGELFAKLGAFAELGARFFCLALDDVPSTLAHDGDRARFGSLAEAHVSLANALRDALPKDATLWLVPTDYAGTADSDYLAALGAGLHADVEVGWTGRSVVSPEIRTDEARARANVLGRKVLVWDNVPVNDGPMRNMLHLGPFRGRDADLATHVSGFLLNPMELAHASAIGLATASAWMRSPAQYEPEAAWRDALAEAGAGAPEAFATFAAAHRFSPLAPNERDPELERTVDALRDALARDEPKETTGVVESLRTQLAARASAAERLRGGLADRGLLAEIDPWLDAHTRETQAMAIAADLLAELAADAPAMQIALALFRMEGRLTQLAPAHRTSYGPRRAIYPQLASLEDEGAHLSPDRALFLDENLAESLVRLAEALALERLTPAR